MKVQQNVVQHNDILLTPSLVHGRITLFTHGLAAIVVLLLPFPIPWWWICQLAILVYLLWSAYQFFSEQRRHPRLCLRYYQGNWQLLTQSHNEPLGYVVAKYYWTRYLVIVTYHPLHHPIVSNTGHSFGIVPIKRIFGVCV